MKCLTALSLLLTITLSSTANASGPSSIAIPDRSLWPHPLNSEEDFNLASRFEILSFVNVVHDKDNADEAAMQSFVNRTTVNMDSIHHWQDKTHKILLENFKAASINCKSNSLFCQPITSYDDLVKIAATQKTTLPDDLHPWLENTQHFHQMYLYEQLRLAALFPGTTSEIDVFSDAEITGSNWPDKQFMLSFDDGPTLANGETDKVMNALHGAGINGVFFVLGNNTQTDLKKENAQALAKRYQGMCVSSHGMEHQSHAKWDQWKVSMEQSSQLFKNTFGDSYVAWFRPPYGQRLPESQNLFYKKTILWNIDSQDWSNKIDADQAGNRVLSLMLLWRRGIILFHDIHPKAAVDVPMLVQRTNGSGIKWIDCHAEQAALSH